MNAIQKARTALINGQNIFRKERMIDILSECAQAENEYSQLLNAYGKSLEENDRLQAMCGRLAEQAGAHQQDAAQLRGIVVELREAWTVYGKSRGATDIGNAWQRVQDIIKKSREVAA